MALFEPPRSWQDDAHNRILRQDVTAFAELCEYALPFLVEFLQARFPNQDTFLHETASIDCLLNYQAKASHYDPGRISLFAFLRMAARRDMLNAIDKKKRRERRLTSISPVLDLPVRSWSNMLLSSVTDVPLPAVAWEQLWGQRISRQLLSIVRVGLIRIILGHLRNYLESWWKF